MFAESFYIITLSIFSMSFIDSMIATVPNSLLIIMIFCPQVVKFIHLFSLFLSIELLQYSCSFLRLEWKNVEV